MEIKSLKLKGFRNYRETQVDFAPAANFLTGQNGQGKTNLLEAVYYLSILKSFRTNVDGDLVRKESDFFFIEGTFEFTGHRKNVLSASYQVQEGKRIKENGKKVARPAEIIGSYPATIVSPEQYIIVSGPPAERRKFIDILLSQTDRTYLQDLIDYNHLVKQKNRLLSNQLHYEGSFQDVLYPWNHSLAEVGSRILQKRFQFVGSIAEEMQESYKKVTQTEDAIGLSYQSTLFQEENDSARSVPGLKEIHEQFTGQLSNLEKRERERGTMLIGPHRDDIIISLNGANSRKFASQGEQKTILLTLKMSEMQYLKKSCGEIPVLLLDDLFSMLDDIRTEGVLDYITRQGQFFITATDSALPEKFTEMYPGPGSDVCHFSIQQGELF